RAKRVCGRRPGFAATKPTKPCKGGRNLFNAETQRTKGAQSATPSNSALQPPLAPLRSAAYCIAKAGTQKAKGDTWWQSARMFGQKTNPRTWRLMLDKLLCPRFFAGSTLRSHAHRSPSHLGISGH